MRIVVLPLSLFTLIVALDQELYWLVIFAILLIISIIVWWYFDEVHAATERKALEDTVLDVVASFGVEKASLSLIEHDLHKHLLMEKFYAFDACKVTKSLEGVYQDIPFRYIEVNCEGPKDFCGHVLILSIKGSMNEKVAMFDAFPYNEHTKHLTIVGSNEEKLEVGVEGVFFFTEDITTNIKESMKQLLEEMDDILKANEVGQ